VSREVRNSFRQANLGFGILRRMKKLINNTALHSPFGGRGAI